MNETFIVIIEAEEGEYRIPFNDFGNAAECALTYREMGKVVRIEIKEL